MPTAAIKIRVTRGSYTPKLPLASSCAHCFLGMTPKAYLKGQRLYFSHRALWHADPLENTVSDIANRLGFWHMGQFAQDYRKIFGAKPSETLALDR